MRRLLPLIFMLLLVLGSPAWAFQASGGGGGGGSGVTCAGCTANTIPKSNGTNLTNSTVTDTGTGPTIPNNTYLQGKVSGGTIYNLLGFDASDVLLLCDATDASCIVQVNATQFNIANSVFGGIINMPNGVTNSAGYYQAGENDAGGNDALGAKAEMGTYDNVDSTFLRCKSPQSVSNPNECFAGGNATVIFGANKYTDQAGTGPPNFPFGLNIAGKVPAKIIYANDNLAQVAAITDTTMFTVGGTSLVYRFSGEINCTGTSAAATASLNLKWTDTGSQAQTQTVTDTCTALGSGSVAQLTYTLRAKTGTAITYGVTIANTPTYDVSVTLESLR